MAVVVGLQGSLDQHVRAERSLARGVATAFRASQRPYPMCFERGRGARIWDVDGNEYVDYVMAFGPLLLGHSPQRVLAAVRRQLDSGLGYGASHRLEAEVAEAVCRTVPSAELCVFSSTGSEAVHAALRIARAFTGRRRVIKFLGHYHGWFDAVHVGVPPQRVAGPGTAGEDPAASESLSVLPWGDVAALESALGEDVAAVIMEPVAVDGGCLMAPAGYLEAARDAAHEAGALLIFDEVITGYRLALGGAQEKLGVLPDLTVLGKALGGGFPISAVCGRGEVMEVVASGRVAHVGTFNLNPPCAAAALAAIETFEDGNPGLYEKLDATGAQLAEMLESEAAAVGLPLRTTRTTGVVQAFITDQPVRTYEDTLAADTERLAQLAGELVQHGVHIISTGRMYLTPEHGSAELQATRTAIRAAAQTVAHNTP